MKKLHLFTANFPTGYGESFLNNELPYLVDQFSEVVIYPYQKKEGLQTAFENKQKVIYRDENLESLRILDYFFLIGIMFKEWITIPQKGFFLKKFRHIFAVLKNGMRLSKWVEKQEFDKEDAFYSFWMNEWALALAILKKRKKISQFVFRVNGYDIYDERHDGNYILFKHFMYQQTSRVFPLSKTSAEYLKKRTPFQDKIVVNYFGTQDVGQVDSVDHEVFTVFTCSSAIPLKRLDKIAKVLCALDRPIQWMHHGEGPTIAEVKKILVESGEKVTFILSEKVANYYEVIERQKRFAPAVFMNLSSTEGLPITIMEALSLGVPILVNDVGSCAEFVNKETGVLVASDEEPERIAKKMVKFMRSNDEPYDRTKIRDFWKVNFSASHNYEKFAIELKTIFE